MSSKPKQHRTHIVYSAIETTQCIRHTFS